MLNIDIFCFSSDNRRKVNIFFTNVHKTTIAENTGRNYIVRGGNI